MTTQISATKPDLNELRTQLALDRTLMAWVRTALTLIGCGFTLAKFVHSLIANGEVVGFTHSEPRHLGVALMGMGILGLLGGIVQYVQYSKQLPTIKTVWSTSLFVAIGLVVVAAWMMIRILTDLKPI